MKNIYIYTSYTTYSINGSERGVNTRPAIIR